jgi:hypothetical protein
MKKLPLWLKIVIGVGAVLVILYNAAKLGLFG